MAFKKMGRAAAASTLALAAGLGLTACAGDHTIGYVYMSASTTGTSGLIDGYKVGYQNGKLTPLADSPVSAGGKNTVAIVATADSKSLYVVNRDDSIVVYFAIGTDGKIYQEKTYNVTGSFPVAAAVDPANKYLFVAFTYQNGPGNTQLYTPANPGPGGITIFPINADDSLGDPLVSSSGGNYFPVGRNPMGIAVTQNGFVYVAAQDPDTTANLLGFSFNPAAANPLTPLPGVTINAGNVASTGFAVGATPLGILADSSGSHLYVTEQASSQIIGYSLDANGIPSQVGAAHTDTLPAGMAFDLTGKFLYVASTGAGAVDGFSLGASGEPVVLSTASSVQAGTGANCVTVIGSPSSGSPTHAVYLYTSNNLSGNVGGMQLDPSNGALTHIQSNPWPGSALPTCIVSTQSFP